MDLRILDTNFNVVKIIDAFKSLLWVDRYTAYGDFELYTPVNLDYLKYIKQDYYICSEESERVMIVETREIESDLEHGSYIRITGASLEKILNRRIIWGRKVINGNFQNAIQSLINESIISPSISARKIPNFIFERSTDSRITSLTVTKEFTGDNLYDAIVELCSLHNVGFKVTLNANNQFVFKLFVGENRGYDQEKNPLVIFSPKFENLVNSNYLESNAEYKNITLIGGEGENDERKYTTYGDGGSGGLNRRELFTDARDIQSNEGMDDEIPLSEYYKLLQARGAEHLNEYISFVAFEGETEPRQMFVYNEDFFIGDIVQLENEYGQSGTTRITEVVTSYDELGFSVYPTFEMVDVN